MSRSAGGDYTLPGGNPIAFGTRPASSSLYNSTFADIATELTDSLSRTGKGAMLADLEMGGFDIVDVVAITASGTVSAAALTASGAVTGATAAISGNATVGGTLGITGVATFTAAPVMQAGMTVTGTVTATTFSGSAASLTNVPAAQITGTLPAIPGTSITDLNATNLTSGTVPDARFPATLPALSGVNLTALNATNLASGTVASARVAGSYTGITAVGTLVQTLNVTGAIVSSGNVTAYSDARLKENFQPMAVCIDDLASIEISTFDRIDSGARECGVTAQALQKVMPLAVRENDNGMLSVDYGRAALIAAITIAKAMKA
jgi:hypothetical protein